MRRLLAVLTILSFLSAISPQPSLANQGGGGGDRDDLPRTSIAAVEFALFNQSLNYLMVIYLATVVQIVTYLHLRDLVQPKQIRKSRGFLFFSSPSETEEVPEVPNPRPLGSVYQFGGSLIIQVDPSFPGADGDPISEKPDAAVRLIETDGKGNADVYDLPGGSLNFTQNSEQMQSTLQGVYSDFEANMDEAKHIGDVDYGWDETEVRHVIRLNYSF
jgi:hypothetical protein